MKTKISPKKIFKRNRLKHKVKQEVVKLNRQNLAPRNVYLFGSGQLADWILQYLDRKKYSPCGYFDNNKQLVGKLKKKMRIESPRFVKDVSVIIASSWEKEIYRQLLDLGFGVGDIFTVSVSEKSKYASSVYRRISYRNFGYLPGGSFKKNTKLRLFGIPNFLKRLQARDIITALELKPDETVLDFGCGSGYITVELAKISKTAVGIDINPNLKRIRVPRNLKDKLKFVNVSGEQLPFPDGYFDVLLASEVLPMIEVASKFLKEIHRVLKPGGRMVIVNGIGRPVIRELYLTNHKRLMRLKGKYPDRFPNSFEEYEHALQSIFGTHVNRFLTESEIKQMLLDNGFEINEVLYSPALPGGAYFEWQQFKCFVMGKDVISTRNFFSKYLFFSFLNKIVQKSYPGGFICRTVKSQIE